MDNEYVCKGSIALGTACGNCARCKRAIDRINDQVANTSCEQGRMPVGVDIEIYCSIEHEWFNVTCMAVGDESAFVRFCDDGHETTISKNTTWRYPIDPEQQKRDDIMEAWRRMSIDFAHDTEKSMVHAGTFIDMLFNKGFVEVEK